MQWLKDSISKLSYPIDPHHQREFFIKVILPMTSILLSHQRNGTLQDALEQAMQIEDMAGYPQDHRVGGPLKAPTIIGLQNKISTLTESLKYLDPARPTIPHVWWTHCQVKGNHSIECSRLRRLTSPCSAPMGPQPLQSRGVAQISWVLLYQGHTQFQLNPSLPSMSTNDYYEICRTFGQQPCLCSILEKYSNVMNNLFC